MKPKTEIKLDASKLVGFAEFNGAQENHNAGSHAKVGGKAKPKVGNKVGAKVGEKRV